MAEATQSGADPIGAASRFEGLLARRQQERDTRREEPETQKEEQAQGEEIQTEEPEVPEKVEREEERQEPTTEEEADDGAQDVQTLADLAAVLGVEADQLHNIRVPTKVNGEEAEVPLSQIVKSYQLESHLTQKSEQLSALQREAQEARERYSENIDQRVQQLDDAIAGLSSIWGEITQVDLDKIMEEEGTEAYLKAERRQRALAEKAQQALAERDLWIQEQERIGFERQQEYDRTQRDKLNSLIPEWKDEAKANTERSKLSEYFQKAEFAPEERTAAAKHAQIVAWARKAMLYDQLISSKPAIKNKVAQAPKVQKPGAAPRSEATNTNITALKARLKKTGSLRDAAALYQARRSRK